MNGDMRMPNESIESCCQPREVHNFISEIINSHSSASAANMRIGTQVCCEREAVKYASMPCRNRDEFLAWFKQDFRHVSVWCGVCWTPLIAIANLETEIKTIYIVIAYSYSCMSRTHICADPLSPVADRFIRSLDIEQRFDLLSISQFWYVPIISVWTIEFR